MSMAADILERERAADLQALIDAQAHALFDELARQTQAPVKRKSCAPSQNRDRLG